METRSTVESQSIPVDRSEMRALVVVVAAGAKKIARKVGEEREKAWKEQLSRAMRTIFKSLLKALARWQCANRACGRCTTGSNARSSCTRRKPVQKKLQCCYTAHRPIKYLQGGVEAISEFTQLLSFDEDDAATTREQNRSLWCAV